MALRIRLFGKKRGGRRTGSERLGSYGEALFFAAFLAIGIGGFVLLLTQLILPQWAANQRFATTECVVLGKGASSNVDPGTGTTLYRPDIHIRYTVGDTPYEATTYDINYDIYQRSLAETEEILAGIDVGATYRCWYDPKHPETAVLVLGYSWWMWLLLLIPGSFMVLGLMGAIRALLKGGTSAERRAAMAQRASKLDLFDDGAQRGLDFPFIPRISHITDSPGTRLAYRLPGDNLLGWKLSGIITLCLLWNGIVISFLIAAINDLMTGDPNGTVMSVTLLPFLLVGLWLVYLTGKRLYAAAGTGATRVEISAHPLLPGESYELLVSQSGHLTMNSISVELVCEEEATYRQGTDTRIERVPVYQREVYRRSAIVIEPGMAFEDRCQFQVPEGAMHSFQSPHNEIRWHVMVTGQAGHKLHYQRRFPVVVYPSAERGAS